MELFLQREASNGRCTFGTLYVDGVRECYTLEDVVRERRYDDGQLIEVSAWKVQNETAIPSGRYAVNVDWSNRFKRLMPHLVGVPGFTGVRIHSGNTAENTEGCILLGRVRGNYEVLESRLAFGEFFAKLEQAIERKEQVFINIENP